MEIAWNDFRDLALQRQMDDMANDPARRKQAAEDRRAIEQCRLEKKRQSMHRTIFRYNAKTSG